MERAVATGRRFPGRGAGQPVARDVLLHERGTAININDPRTDHYNDIVDNNKHYHKHHDPDYDHDEFDVPANYPTAVHHHHGDDGSTLYHQHDGSADHDHIIYDHDDLGTPDDNRAAANHYGSADHGDQ
jgi:hypothetical protein